MSKHILIINGSPRAGGNTDLLCRAVKEGAESSEKSATQMDIAKMNIAPCTGCYQCTKKRGTPCSIQDDMQLLYDEAKKADAIVLASPLYFWHFTAQMKIVIDRSLAVFAVNGMKVESRKLALVIAAEDTSAANFEYVVSFYENCLVKNLNMRDGGQILAGGLESLDAVNQTPYIKQAVALGQSL